MNGSLCDVNTKEPFGDLLRPFGAVMEHFARLRGSFDDFFGVLVSVIEELLGAVGVPFGGFYAI